jgi:hypothetical protein
MLLESRQRDASDGLWMEASLELETQLGREVNALIKPNPRPAINGLSIGFEPDWESSEWIDDVLVFKKVTIWEISVVTFAANPGARIEDALSAEKVNTKRDLEHLLRDAAGLTRKQAVAIASRFEPTTPQRDADGAPGQDMRAALDAMRNIFPRK